VDRRAWGGGVGAVGGKMNGAVPRRHRSGPGVVQNAFLFMFGVSRPPQTSARASRKGMARA